MTSSPHTYSLGLNSQGLPYQFYVIDDSSAMIKIITRTICNIGGEVVGSTTEPMRVIQKVSPLKSKIDIVTLDINMPTKNGLMLISEILDCCPTIKIVMVSAMASTDRVKEAIILGASHFVVKPFTVEQFFAVVKSVTG